MCLLGEEPESIGNGVGSVKNGIRRGMQGGAPYVRSALRTAEISASASIGA